MPRPGAPRHPAGRAGARGRAEAARRVARARVRAGLRHRDRHGFRHRRPHRFRGPIRLRGHRQRDEPGRPALPGSRRRPDPHLGAGLCRGRAHRRGGAARRAHAPRLRSPGSRVQRAQSARPRAAAGRIQRLDRRRRARLMLRRETLAFLLIAPALLAAGGTGPAIARAPSVEATVTDQSGKPVLDAVVTLTPVGGPPPVLRPSPAVMDQVNQEFVPAVPPVVVGTSVSFPNRDNIRHHVYSFSPAKKFELPLYIGTPSAPVVFDKPGPVALGCNIHDWMVAYVYVVATPYFAKTGAGGRARLEGVPAGPYEARVWHPRLRGETAARPITLAEDEDGRVSLPVTLRPESRPVPRRDPYEGQQSGG